jgi:hypothetical protein
MAHGKHAARDLRYGRRGGRWAEGQPVNDSLADLAKLREQGIADGSWPGSEHGAEQELSLFDPMDEPT